MSILIKGMDMPKEGDFIVIRPDGKAYYVSANPQSAYEGEAVPISPHGRLIDADELADQINSALEAEGDRWLLSPERIAQRTMRVTDLRRILNAPTIIPAELSKEES